MTATRIIDDHLELENIGTNSHAQIDTHIAAADDYVKRDGSLALTSDWDIGDTRKILADEIRARDGAGLKLYDDAGNGLFVEDGGQVGVGTTNPSGRLHVQGNQYIGYADGSVTSRLYLYQGAGGTAGRTVSLRMSNNQLYLNNDYARVYIEKAGNEAHALAIQEGDTPWQTLTWWFDGTSGTGTGMWFHTEAGNMNFKMSDAAGAADFKVLDSNETVLFDIDSNGLVGIKTPTPTAKLDINSDILRLRTAKTPASAGAAGNQGDVCWDADYIYVCTATNTWKRTAISTW